LLAALQLQLDIVQQHRVLSGMELQLTTLLSWLLLLLHVLEVLLGSAASAVLLRGSQSCNKLHLPLDVPQCCQQLLLPCSWQSLLHNMSHLLPS
jgi:hypothetical protein